MIRVIDVSVAVKWFLKAESHPNARYVLEKTADLRRQGPPDYCSPWRLSQSRGGVAGWLVELSGIINGNVARFANIYIRAYLMNR